jgi:hypothetical protein
LSGAEPASPHPPASDQAETKPEPTEHFSSGLGEQLRQQQQYVPNTRSSNSSNSIRWRAI